MPREGLCDMYNLFVSGDDNDWEGEPFLTEIERCVREYTDTDITRRYENLNATSIGVLQRLPCIFAYESRCKKLPKFGVIRSVTKRERQGRVSVDYQIKEIGSFLTLENLAALAFDLDIDKYEMNRTHWAVKNVNLARELKSVGIVLPGWARTLSKAVNIATHR